jgi:hypothetical protein
MKKMTAALLMIVFAAMLAPTAQAESKTYWARGMWIGAVAGGVVGGAIAGGAVATSHEESDARGNWPIVAVMGAGCGALIGMGIGAGIGAAIPKRQEFQIVPTMMTSPKGIVGGGVGIHGSF